MYGTIYDCIKDTISQFEKDRSFFGAYRPPLLAFLSAHGERLSLLKEMVSPEHLMPADILPDAESVIVFFLPFGERIIEGNREGTDASPEWAQAYILTNELIARISGELESLLAAGFGGASYRAGKIPATGNFDQERLISNWSHRHIAFLAGLGSFGANNMLITSSGSCGRFGSLVTGMPLPSGASQFFYTRALRERMPQKPLSRPFHAEKPVSADTQERCLWKRGAGCLRCIKRCPVNAYSVSEGKIIFDRRRCYARCLKNAELYQKIGLADVCGKCLTGLPCSTESP
jgi:epoxyqueuosine reductase QueG